MDKTWTEDLDYKQLITKYSKGIGVFLCAIYVVQVNILSERNIFIKLLHQKYSEIQWWKNK